MALIGWVVTIGAAAAAEAPDELARRSADLLVRAIRVPTVNPPGNEAPLAELFARELAAAGVEAKVVPTGAGGQRAALWARVHGRGEARPIVLLSHLDVVPADPAEWSMDPFAGEIHAGRVYGRGALDAKGVTVVHAMTLLELAGRDARPARDVILVAAPDEETGGRSGAGALVRDRPGLIADAEYLLAEGGSISVRGADGASIWGVTITEKSPCWLEVATRGRAGHSSAPTAEAAVPRLVAALDRVRRVESPVDLRPEVERMFREMAEFAPAEERAGYLDLTAALAIDSRFRRRFLSDPGRNALVRNTIAITVLQGGPRTNVAPTEARAHLDVRLLPGESCDHFRDALVDVIGDPGVDVRILLSFVSRSSSSDTPLFHAIERVAAEIDPRSRVVPRMISGFTDAHWFRELGIVSYGFVPRRMKPDEARGVHGVDESISLDNLAYGVRTLVRILDALDEPDSAER